MSLQIVITDAGRAEVVNAQGNGTAPITLLEVGFGTGIYTASADRTSLQSEVKRLSTIAGAAVGDDTIHVSVTDQSADSYQVNEIGIYTDSGTLFAVYSQTDPIIEKSAGSAALLAVDIALQSLNPASVTFGDTNFAYPAATSTTKGAVELATNSETQTGTDTQRAVTPSALSSRTATTTRTGLVELATNTEAQAGSDSTRAMTPAATKSAIESLVPSATDSKKGIVELATNSETQSGTDSSRAVTPASLSSRTATTSRTGLVELATNSEAAALSSSSRVLTPAALAYWFSQRGVYSEENNEMVGAVAFFITTVAPDGWIKANGAAVSRSTYSRLFGKIGTFWGNGNGSSTFNLPDLRGDFIRCWDDGRGVDSGRSFGSFQGDQIESHRHGFESETTYYPAVDIERFGGTNTSLHVGPKSGTRNTEYAGGNETRPRNRALIAYIKY